MSPGNKRKPRKPGRAPKELTPEFVFACGKLFCTQEEIGDLCGLAQQTISDRINNDPELLQAYRSGRAQARMSLRRAQYKKAVTEGNMVAQIWLGKQELGQTDKQESHETHDLNLNVQYIAAWGKTPEELPPPPSDPSLALPTTTPDTPAISSPPSSTPSSDSDTNPPHSASDSENMPLDHFRTSLASSPEDDVIDSTAVDEDSSDPLSD